MEEFVTNAGDKLKVHSRQDCRGPVCPIHNPTPHHMREWPMIWRGDRQIFERICDHGIGHPDPDDQEAKLFIQGFMDGVHGCDGCCQRPREGKWIRALSFYPGDITVEGFLSRKVTPYHFDEEGRQTWKTKFEYFVTDRQNGEYKIKFETAVEVREPEYTMVDFDPELR